VANPPDPMKVKDEMSSFAEEIALKGFGKHLDYSPQSIHEVEEMLGALHEDYVRTGSDDGYYGVALEFAAYIAKVVESHFGPIQWTRDHPVFGKESLPLTWQGGTIFPVSWCLKRMLDGPGENVWSKFDLLVLNREKGQGPVST
jgi:hypothetical protein